MEEEEVKRNGCLSKRRERLRNESNAVWEREEVWLYITLTPTISKKRAPEGNR